LNPTQNPRRRFVLISVFILLGVVGIVFFLWPRNAFAHIQFVDASGKLIVGAIVRGEGLRTKQVRYCSGWYGFNGFSGGMKIAGEKPVLPARRELNKKNMSASRLKRGALFWRESS
jgi:hypothetical protein